MEPGVNMKCEAHELLEREIERCKNNEQELYTLDRTRSQTMAEIQKDIAEIKTDHKNMKEDIQEFKKDLAEVKTDQSEMKADVKELKNEMITLQKTVTEVKELAVQNASKKQWEKKDLCVIIVALISLAGTIITAFIK